MGWQDRHYSDGSYHDAPATRFRRPPALTLALMILHGAALFVVLAMQEGQAAGRPRPAVLRDEPRPLAVLLHPYGTGSLLSTLFVVLALWSLGGRLEPRLGRPRLALLYVLGNLLAGMAYAGVALLRPGLAGAALDYPVGALAGLCAAAWRHLRHEPVSVLGRITTAAKVYLLCAALVAGLVLVRAGAGAAAWLAAATAGAGIGLLLESWPGWRWPRWRFARRRRRRPVHSAARAAAPAGPSPEDAELDELLAKIARGGLDSLTPQERERLEAVREAKLRSSRRR